MDIIVNTSLSHIFFFSDLAARSGEYSLFSGSCNRRFGGGDYRTNTLPGIIIPSISRYNIIVFRVSCYRGGQRHAEEPTVNNNTIIIP